MRPLFLLFLLCVVARAEDIYVAQNAAGADDGTSCANAKALSWLHTSGNWGSGAGKVSAGDTFHCCGTFTNQVRFLAGGTLGSRITLQGEPGVKFVGSVLWVVNAGSWICTSNFSNITVDGGPDGYLEFTDNGTLLTYQLGAHGIMGPPAGGTPIAGGEITVSNWRMTNIYVWASSGVNYSTPGSGVYLNCGAASNIVVRNVTVTNAVTGIHVTYGTGMSFGWEFYSNRTHSCNWGIAGGDTAANSRLNGMHYHHNLDTHKSAWDCDAEGHHHNGTYFWADQSGSSLSNFYYYASRFDPQNTTDATACIFVSSAANGVYHINVYNNWFLSYPGPGTVVSIWGGANARVFNNTFMGDNNTVCVRFLGMTGYLLNANNLFFNIWCPMNITDAGRAAASPFESDYNSFYSLNPNGGRWGDAGQYTWAQWLAGPYDTHSITNLNPANNPLLTSTNSPYDANIQAGSPMIGAGTNVSAFGYPGQSVDINGVTRANPPAIGACEFQAATVPAAAVALTGQQTWSGAVRFQ